MPEAACPHIDAITDVLPPKRRECEECVKIGATWVHLRTCQECGTTRCCDDSPNRHATEHAKVSGHPVIASAEPGERLALLLSRRGLRGVLSARYRRTADWQPWRCPLSFQDPERNPHRRCA